MENDVAMEYLRILYRYSADSSDTSTKNAALLVVPYGRAVAFGMNDTPSRLFEHEDQLPMSEPRPERLERPLKYMWTEHAERAVIYSAARSGIATRGLTMVCVWAACADCARAIVLSGIKELIRHRVPQHDARPDWNASIEVADQILIENGVSIVDIREPVGAKMFFNGEWIDV
jgi:dCMP deaminase